MAAAYCLLALTLTAPSPAPAGTVTQSNLIPEGAVRAAQPKGCKRASGALPRNGTACVRRNKHYAEFAARDSN